MTKRAAPNGDARKRDEELGMSQPITRRDLLHGVGVAVVGSMAAPFAAPAEERTFAPERAADYYPPTLTGLRGTHKGSFEVAHERAWRGRECGPVRAKTRAKYTHPAHLGKRVVQSCGPRSFPRLVAGQRELCRSI